MVVIAEFLCEKKQKNKTNEDDSLQHNSCNYCIIVLKNIHEEARDVCM